MKILGIDPGLSVTGYGVIEIARGRPRALDFGGIYNRGKSLPLAERLQTIYEGVRAVIEQQQPQEFAIENVFFHENVNTAIVMGHARGVAMLAAQQAGMTVNEYAAREVKMSTVGTGAASKQQVQAMVQKLLSMKELPRPQDAADALAVALCHFHRLKYNMILRSGR